LAQALVVSAAIILLLTAVVPAQQPVPRFEEIVEKISTVNASLETFRVEQGVDAKFMFLRYVLNATVFAARPEDALAVYIPRVISWKQEDDRRWLHLSLEGRNAEANSGACRGAH
jgi:hypothetical protein